MKTRSKALIISCFTALASVSLLCLSTYAWIADFSSVNLSYSNMSALRGEEAVVEATIVKYDIESNQAKDVTSESDSLTLHQYDAIITSVNAYNPIYIIAEVTPASGKVGNYSCTVSTETSSWSSEGSETEMDACISNLIQFKAATAGTSGFESLDESDLTTFYADIQAAFSSSSFSTFVSYDDSSGISINSKQSSLDILSSLSAESDGSSSMTIYIELDYNASLIEYFYTHRAGFDLGDVTGETISFLSDVSSFLFGVAS